MHRLRPQLGPYLSPGLGPGQCLSLCLAQICSNWLKKQCLTKRRPRSITHSIGERWRLYADADVDWIGDDDLIFVAPKKKTANAAPPMASGDASASQAKPHQPALHTPAASAAKRTRLGPTGMLPHARVEPALQPIVENEDDDWADEAAPCDAGDFDETQWDASGADVVADPCSICENATTESTSQQCAWCNSTICTTCLSKEYWCCDQFVASQQADGITHKI